MDIKVQDFVDRIEANTYTHFEATKSDAVANKDGIAALLTPALAAISEAVATGHLAQAKLVLTGKANVVYRLETGVVNLPFENTKKVFQFYDLEETVPVRIYLITEAEDLNASGFRIDEMGTADDLMTNEAAVAAKVNAQASEQWTYVNAHLGEVAAAKEKAAAAFKAKQAAAKKTPAKKTPAKRTTTRRKTTTARKTTAAAKKPTTAAAKRTTAAKKTTTAAAKRTTTKRTTTAAKRTTTAKKTTTTRRTTAAKKTTN
ncbi:MAG: hypothetical protein LKF36_14150 [Lactobacillus sp.]|jgi:hypothetical protein|nr:hypothetical protein [Lactobacillus sp.]